VDAGRQCRLRGSRSRAHTPNDIDISVRRAADVSKLATVLKPAEPPDDPVLDPRTFLSTTEQPVITFANDTWTLGRWLIGGTKVEVAHILSDDDLVVETSGAAVWRYRQSVDWRDRNVPIMPLEVQLATMLIRELPARVHAAAERPRLAATMPNFLIRP